MKFNRLNLLILSMTVASFVHAAGDMQQSTLPTQMGAIERSEAKRAAALLDLAVEYLQKNGAKKSFAAFSDRRGFRQQ